MAVSCRNSGSFFRSRCGVGPTGFPKRRVSRAAHRRHRRVLPPPVHRRRIRRFHQSDARRRNRLRPDDEASRRDLSLHLQLRACPSRPGGRRVSCGGRSRTSGFCASITSARTAAMPGCSPVRRSWTAPTTATGTHSCSSPPPGPARRAPRVPPPSWMTSGSFWNRASGTPTHRSTWTRLRQATGRRSMPIAARTPTCTCARRCCAHGRQAGRHGISIAPRCWRGAFAGIWRRRPAVLSGSTTRPTGRTTGTTTRTIRSISSGPTAIFPATLPSGRSCS